MSRDFRTKQRMMKITPASVEAALEGSQSGKGEYVPLSAKQILVEIGVYPDLDKVQNEDVKMFHYVVNTLSKKVRDCSRQSENIEDSWRSSTSSYIYIPDSVLQRRKNKELRIQQKQQNLETTLENNTDFTDEGRNSFVYKDQIHVDIWMEGENIHVTCREFSAGKWVLYQVKDTVSFVDSLMNFVVATKDIEFKSLRLSMA